MQRNKFSSLALVTCATIVSAVTIPIDVSTRYQTIVGFGGFMENLSDAGPLYSDRAFTDFLHDDLGVTLFRVQLPSVDNFERTNDNNDPQTQNWAAFDISLGSQMDQTFKAINNLKRFDDVRFIGSIWSPPSWMKDNNSLICGSVRSTMYAELAEYFYAFCKLIKDKTNVDIYAISIQNEPAFCEPYPSVVYSPTQYRDALKVMGHYFEQKGYPMRFFGAEHMAWAFKNAGDFVDVIRRDPEALRYIYAWAVHGYQDGITADHGSFDQISATDKALWMTETSGYDPNNWADALQLAEDIQKSLKFAKMSAWVYWQLENANWDEGSRNFRLLSATRTHTSLSLVSKNFYRFIRPGAIMVGCGGPTTGLLASAFVHHQQSTMTVVVVNKGAATSLSLQGQQVPAQFTKYVTTSSKRCVNEGNVQAGNIPIDGSSVTTLVAQGFIDPSPVVRHPMYRTLPPRGVGTRADGRVWSVDGRAYTGRGMTAVIAEKFGGTGRKQVRVSRHAE